MRLVEKLRRIAAPAPARDPAAKGTNGFPGEEIDGKLGRFWRRRVRFPLEHTHGALRLDEIGTTSASPLSGIAREGRLRKLTLDRAVFFDTETTSLGGGVGTYVFLLGAGYFEDDAFVVDQFFLREMTEERALLDAVNGLLGRFEWAVSFHGKGFDAPRLSGRLAFHRMRTALPDVHLDLCLVGRSLYRGAFQDCRLQTFERELVRFPREDDLPGAECPRAFFSHLQGDSSLIARVFEHNLYDVLTLPAVAVCFVREVEQPRHPVVLANLGSYFEVVGRDKEARTSYEHALSGLREQRHPLLPRTLERFALLERRAGRHSASAELLLERAKALPHAFQPLEDLAKYYEHRARDLAQAEATALDARSRLVTGKIEVDRGTRARHLEALDHRLDRLRRRMGRGSHSA
ncbi:MAG: ribonuclease H-like domain-containing protein [Planctomycetota bacterium]|jgi:uncharacterized protein YprB with RNaseH-like and TPR domain